jgi:hypothetical protein
MDSVIDHYIHCEIFEARKELQEAEIRPVVKKSTALLSAPTEIDRIVAWSLRIAEMTDGIVCDGDALANNPEPFANIHVFVDIVAWLQRAELRYRTIQKIFAQLVTQSTLFLQGNGLQSRSALSVLFLPKIRKVLWKYAEDLSKEISPKEASHVSLHLHKTLVDEKASSNDLLGRLLYVATELSLKPSDSIEEELKSWQTRPLELPHFLTGLLFAEVRERRPKICSGIRPSHVQTHLTEPRTHRTHTAVSKHTTQGDLTTSLGFKEFGGSKKKERTQSSPALAPRGVILGRFILNRTP